MKISPLRWQPTPVSGVRPASGPDQVELGGASAPTCLPRPAAPAPERPLGWSQLRSLDPAQLQAFRDKVPDPLLRRIAAERLQRQGGDYWSFRYGDVEGPAVALSLYEESWRQDPTSWVVDEEHLIRPLELLDHKLEGQKIPEAVLRVAAHSVETLQVRSAHEPDPSNHFKIHPKEPASQDRELVERVVRLLEGWWSRGQIEVTRDGERMAPGRVDLRQALGARPAVVGSTLRLESPPPESSKLAVSLLGELYGLSTSGPDPGTQRLLELCTGQPELGDQVVAGILAASRLDEDYLGLEKVVRLVQSAAKEPALKRALKPHLARLRTYSSRAAARGSLTYVDRDGWRVYDLYQALLRAFPECADRELLEKEAAPLLFSSQRERVGAGCGIAEAVFRLNPEMLPAVLELVMEGTAEQSALLPGHRELFSKALEEQGWKPDARQLRWILDRLYEPGRDGMFGDKDRAGEVYLWLKTLADLKPDLEGVQVPDAGGGMRPFKLQLVDQVLGDSQVAPKHLLSAEQGPPVIGLIRQLVLPDPRVADLLLGRLREGLAGGPADKLPAPARKALAFLSSIAPDDARLEPLLVPHLFVPLKEREVAELLEPSRERFIGREAGAIRGAEAQMRLLTAAHCSASFTGAEQLSRRVLEAYRPGFGELEKVLEEVCGALAAAPTWSDRTLAGIELVRTHGDAPLKGRLDAALEGPLRTFQGAPASLGASAALYRLRQERLERLWEQLRQSPSPELVEECRTAGREVAGSEEKTVEAWMAGLERSGGDPYLRRVFATVDHWRALRVYDWVSQNRLPGEPLDASFRVFASMMGVTRDLPEAGKTYLEFLERVPAGGSWEEALHGFLKARLQSEPADRIKVEGDQVWVGRVPLPIRRRS